MHTVTVGTSVFQFEELYEDERGNVGFLRAYDEDSGFELGINGVTWQAEQLNLTSYTAGTITDAPIVLEDGEMCLFTYKGEECLGFYSKANDTFINYVSTICFLNEAIMITPLRERT